MVYIKNIQLIIFSAPFSVFKSSGNGSCPLPGHHYKWGNSYQPPGMMWPNSPSYIDGVCAATNLPRLHGLPRSASQRTPLFYP